MRNSDSDFNLKRVVVLALKLLSPRDRKWLAVMASIQALIGLLDLVGIVFLGALSSVVLNGLSSRSYGDRLGQFLALLKIENNDFNFQILFLASVAIGAIFSRILLSVYLSRRILTFLSIRSAHVSRRLFQKMLEEGLDFIKRRTALNSQFAINRGIDLIMVGCLGILMTLLADALSLAFIFFGLLVIDPKFALALALAFSFLGTLLHLVLRKKTERVARDKTTFEIASNQKIQDTLLTFREVHVRNQQSLAIREFSELRLKSAKAIADSMFLPSVPKFVFESTVIVAAVFMGLFQLLANDVFRAISTLTIFLAAGTRVAPGMLRIQQGFMALKSNLGQTAPTREILTELNINNLDSLNTRAKTPRISPTKSNAKNLISFENVNYERSTSPRFLLKDLTFFVRKGEFVALTGRSGSGKSTIIDLMLGLLEPTTGKISIRGLSPRLAISEFQHEISYIPQDVHIFPGTVRENIQVGMGDQEVPDSKIWKVLSQVQLESHVKLMSQGLDSQLGEFGNVLSGGQRQRIGIARALLSSPKILVMDESTSALDSETENSILEVLKNLQPRLTIVAIAHRLSTLAKSDRIIYVAGGKIEAQGTFKEVLENHAGFKRQIKTLKN
jgi:ABC-type multidrug transport system fused ATPase/permease subunit